MESSENDKATDLSVQYKNITLRTNRPLYVMSGQAVITRSVFMPEIERRSIEGRTRFDDWLSTPRVRTIIYSSKALLKKYGYTRVKQMHFAQKSMTDIQLEGQCSLAFFAQSDDGIEKPSLILDTVVTKIHHDDVKSVPSTGSIWVGDIDYGLQVHAAGYGLDASEVALAIITPKILREMCRHFDSLSDLDQTLYVSKVIEAFIESNNRSLMEGLTSTAVVDGLPYIQQIQVFRQAILPHTAFEPGGKVYRAFRNVADRDAVIERLTGVSAEKLNSDKLNPIPQQHTRDYARLYAIASKLADEVVKGRVLPSDAKRVLDRVQSASHLPWDASQAYAAPLAE